MIQAFCCCINAVHWYLPSRYHNDSNSCWNPLFIFPIHPQVSLRGHFDFSIKLPLTIFLQCTLVVFLVIFLHLILICEVDLSNYLSIFCLMNLDYPSSIGFLWLLNLFLHLIFFPLSTVISDRWCLSFVGPTIFHWI